MWEKINNFLKGQIVTSLIYIVLGICLVFMPVNMINVICKFVFGILLILVGLYHILIYVAEKLNSTIFDLFSGGILMVLGIFLFMNPQIVVKLLPILLGTFILVDSIWTLKGSFKLKKRGVDTWRFLVWKPDFYCAWYFTCGQSVYDGKIHSNFCRMDFPVQRNH